MPFYYHPTQLCVEHFRVVEEVNAGIRTESYRRAWLDGVTVAYHGDIPCIAGYLIMDADNRKMEQDGFEDANMCGGVIIE